MLCEFGFGASWAILTAGYCYYSSLTKTAIFFKYFQWHKSAPWLEYYCFSAGMLQMPRPCSKKKKPFIDFLEWNSSLTEVNTLSSMEGGFHQSISDFYRYWIITLNPDIILCCTCRVGPMCRETGDLSQGNIHGACSELSRKLLVLEHF